MIRLEHYTLFVAFWLAMIEFIHKILLYKEVSMQKRMDIYFEQLFYMLKL